MLINGLRWCRRLMASDALADMRGPETLLGPAVGSNDELQDNGRARGATVYHAVSTCRMGDVPMVVVDARLKVYGLDRLRVVDASVMPTMVSANINAAILMIAEKAANMIVEDWRVGT